MTVAADKADSVAFGEAWHVSGRLEDVRYDDDVPIQITDLGRIRRRDRPHLVGGSIGGDLARFLDVEVVAVHTEDRLLPFAAQELDVDTVEDHGNRSLTEHGDVAVHEPELEKREV